MKKVIVRKSLIELKRAERQQKNHIVFGEVIKLKSEIKDFKPILDLRDKVVNINVKEGAVDDF